MSIGKTGLFLAAIFTAFCVSSGIAEEDYSPSGTIEDGVRVVKVEAFKYGFKPDPIIVKRGEKIRLEVTSTDVTHGFAVKEFGINATLPAKKTVPINFKADKTGNFTVRCSVYCGSGHLKMQGRLKVIDPSRGGY